MTGRATPYRVVKVARRRPVWVDFTYHEFMAWYLRVWPGR